MNAAGGAGRRWPWLVLFGALLVVGAYLRVAQLATQMLMDDEWHAVRMLLQSGYAGIARHFGLADHSIPLTLYYRWLYVHGLLDEWSMHLPLLVAGLALLVLAPGLLRRLPLPTRVLWCGLLAISPPLVYFSRTARPYALLALAGLVALVAFRNWQAGGPRRHAWAGAYLVASVLAGWAHPLSLVFTLWPFVHYGMPALLDLRRRQQRRQAGRRLAGLAGLGAATLVPLALLLGPPLVADWDALVGKAGASSVSAASFGQTLLMQFGVVPAWLCLGLIALAVLGAWRLAQREPDLLALTLGASLAGGMTIALAEPAWIQHAPVLVRYAAPVLPFLLLYLAEGLAAVIGRLRAPGAQAATAGAVLVGLVAAGPLPDWYVRPNQFMEHAAFQFDYDRRTNPYWTLLELGPVSPFYRQLAARPPGSVTLIETPARAVSNYSPDPWLQAIHHQNIKYALASPVCGIGAWDELPYPAQGVHFRRLLHLDEVLAGHTAGADYLVMRLAPWTLPRKDFPWPSPWPDMPACVAKVAARLGPPVWCDAQIAVFALARPDGS